MARRKIPVQVVGGMVSSRSKYVNDQLCENWIYDKEGALYPTPGLKYYMKLGSGPCRTNNDAVEFQGEAFFVSGDKLVSIDVNGAGTVRGTLETSKGSTYMASGFSHIVVVDGSYAYVWDGSTLTKQVAPPYGEPSSIMWCDQYYIFTQKGTGKFFVSEVDDPTTIVASNFATAEKKADNLVRAVWYQGAVLLVGESTVEQYYNAGTNFPWQPYDMPVLEQGSPAPDSIVTAPNMGFMLAHSSSGGYEIVKVSSTNPQRISNANIEWEMGQFTTVSDAEAYYYSQSGHEFYVITFPTAERTWCYDVTTGAWHERKSGSNRHRAKGHIFFKGKHIVGDFENSNFYTLDEETYLDNGEAIIRKRRMLIPGTMRGFEISISDPINAVLLGGEAVIDLSDGVRKMAVESLRVDFEPGTALANGQGSDPQLMMRYSNDACKTFGTKTSRSMGKIGENKTMIKWARLGSARVLSKKAVEGLGGRS